MDAVAVPALLPEILGEPPYREVDLRCGVLVGGNHRKLYEKNIQISETRFRKTIA